MLVTAADYALNDIHCTSTNDSAKLPTPWQINLKLPCSPCPGKITCKKAGNTI